MNEWKNLIDVKSLITLALTILFIVLSIIRVIDGNAVMTIYTTVIAFYFGTQYQKKVGANNVENSKEIDSNK